MKKQPLQKGWLEARMKEAEIASRLSLIPVLGAI